MATSYEIHPAIGIARVGSSRLPGEEGYFLGPEPGVGPPRKYRDPAGDLKRQAVRFRLLRCIRDEHRRLLEACEVEPADVRRLSWTVRLANRKGAARRAYGSGPGRRNGASGDDEGDRELIIEPRAATVASPGVRVALDDGRFRSVPVALGEIFMESTGRLVVLGGHGRSDWRPGLGRRRGGPDRALPHRVDNDDWHDDTSDGLVEATVELADGTTAGSLVWVIVGPPDFAPGVANQVTLYDVLFDQAVRRGLLPSPAAAPGGVSFSRHVRPILERAMGYRWVNRAAQYGRPGSPGSGHGPGGGGDFSGLWDVLSDPSSRSESLRRSIAERLRDPDPAAAPPRMDPLAYIPRLTDVQRGRSDAGNVLPLTATQYAVMQAWARGEFVGDEGALAFSPEPAPDALDRTALEACVGGALYPGVEAGSAVLCDPTRYLDGEPFRLSPAWVRPGEVTAQNAVPWQADFAACRWEESDGPWPKRLGWWPAQRPDDVFPVAGSGEMVPWARGLRGDFLDMVEKWDRLGFVVDRGAEGSPFFAEDERDGRALGP